MYTSLISFHFISFHFISLHFISFHFISFHFISFHFISLHFISFHFISFHFISFPLSSPPLPSPPLPSPPLPSPPLPSQVDLPKRMGPRHSHSATIVSGGTGSKMLFIFGLLGRKQKWDGKSVIPSSLIFEIGTSVWE